jgi:hypothetical protein
MRVAVGLVVVLEELSELVLRKVSFGRFGLVVNDTGGERHLGRSGDKNQRKKKAVSLEIAVVRGKRGRVARDSTYCR